MCKIIIKPVCTERKRIRYSVQYTATIAFYANSTVQYAVVFSSTSVNGPIDSFECLTLSLNLNYSLRRFRFTISIEMLECMTLSLNLNYSHEVTAYNQHRCLNV